jgi:aldehyde dehydrogenase (NAD+)
MAETTVNGNVAGAAATATAPPPRTLANFIAGSWRAPAVDDYVDDRNPARPDELVARVPLSTHDDVEAAVAAAHAAFPAWKKTSAVKRGEILVRAAAALRERAEELAQLMTREQGKTLAESRGEVARAAQFWSWMGHQGGAIQGTTAPTEADEVSALVLREPLGPVALITPWNFPVNIPSWKLASALVCGNSVVLKPAQQTAGCAAILVEALDAAGMPPGVVNLVLGSGRAIGGPLATDARIKAISFTGSTEVGLALNAQAAAQGKKVQCEMGGHNAVIVLADADLEKAAKGCVAAAFGTTGQRCTAARRILAERAIVEPLTALLLEETRKLTVGPGEDPASDIGPLVDAAARDDVLAQIERARQEGATVLAGGEVPGGELAQGAYLQPTLLGCVTQGMTITTEEVFGPVLPIVAVDSYDEAIAHATATRYGLSSSIYTRDQRTIMRFLHETDTGVVHVNKPPIGGEAHLPFGGLKESSVGPKEMGAAVEFFTQTKTVYWDWSA